MYSHDNTGNKISGNKDELEEAVLTGALIKVNLYDQYYLQVQTAYVIDGNVCGQIKAAIAHQDYDTFAVSVATYLEDLT